MAAVGQQTPWQAGRHRNAADGAPLFFSAKGGHLDDNCELRQSASYAQMRAFCRPRQVEVDFDDRLDCRAEPE